GVLQRVFEFFCGQFHKPALNNCILTFSRGNAVLRLIKYGRKRAYFRVENRASGKGETQELNRPSAAADAAESVGGRSPKCCQACWVTILPRGVRIMKPCWIR